MSDSNSDSDLQTNSQRPTQTNHQHPTQSPSRNSDHPAQNLQTKKFQRCKESFTCEQCDTHVTGDGYTDHCPKCLWSKHVDINPGDRASNCNGMMEPIGYAARDKSIHYICKKCGKQSKVRSANTDGKPLLINLSGNPTLEEPT